MGASEYERNVFVNCPFDDDYQGLFDAMVFTISKCGFLPRCAREVDDASVTRLDKILRIVRDCKYGIHDVSRTELNRQGLPRFNMPLELGLFLGAKFFGSGIQKQKRCLILDRDAYRYQQFISDIAGQDATAHGNEASRAVTAVRDWLAQDVANLPGGRLVWSEFQKFQGVLPDICQQLRLEPSELTFPDYVRALDEWFKYELPKRKKTRAGARNRR